MNEIQRAGNTIYDRYEELLLEKAALRKECFLTEREYTRVFGGDLLMLYRLQIECVRKKKTIEFCQRAVNRGEDPDEAALQAFIMKETEDLQENFRRLAAEYESARNVGEITEADLMKIRKIYRHLAKLLHPDLHPQTAESEDLMEFWNQIVVAYACNDLRALEELDVLVAVALTDEFGNEWKSDIPDLEERIKTLEDEIELIKSKDPYQYKFLLDDPGAVLEKKNDLQEQMHSYREYSRKLDQILEDILPEGMIILWSEGAF